MFIYLHIIYGCLLTTTANSCDRDCMAFKAKYICYVTLYRKKSANSCLLLLLVLMYVLLLKQLLADIGTTDTKWQESYAGLSFMSHLWRDFEITWTWLGISRAGCTVDVIPGWITLLILNYDFLMWLCHESHRTRHHSMPFGWVQVGFPLKGVCFLTVSRPGKRVILG